MLRRPWILVAMVAAGAAGALLYPHLFPPAEPIPAPVNSAPSTPDRSRPLPADDAAQPPLPAKSDAVVCPIRFRDVTDASGITFVHTDGSSGEHYIVETVTTGMASFDYDGDGLIDLYFPNGAPLRGTRMDRQPRHALYKNLGGWRFKDVTEEAGVACTAYGQGVCVGDYNNDGFPDLYLSNYGPKVLYRNNGNGTFTDVTREAGVADGDKLGAGVCFLDIDGDGNLDLYAANYVKFNYQTHVIRKVQGLPMYPGPRDYEQYWPDSLFRNNGDGTFADISKESGIASVVGPGMGTVCLDYDNDGDTDIFVCNDVRENFLFQNDGKGKFQEVGLTAGVAYNAFGQANGNMGADCGDYDNDGWLDILRTDYQDEYPVLYRNLGKGMFDDVTLRTGAGAGALPWVKWGCGMIDFDNDGHKDLFYACGHIQDNIDQTTDRTAYKNHNILMWNTGNGKFVNVSEQCGLTAIAKHSARGAVFDDLDNDGDIDVVILNSRERPTVLRNMYYELGGKHHWLQLRLEGVKTNRDGVGARVRVVAGDLAQIDEVHSGRGYQGHFGSRLHFGLGDRDRVDRIEVRWIGGGVDVLENVKVDQQLTIREGFSGQRAAAR